MSGPVVAALGGGHGLSASLAALRFVTDDVDGEQSELHGLTPGGEELVLGGPWRLTHRRSGALPKHVVDAELGPEAG